MFHRLLIHACLLVLPVIIHSQGDTVTVMKALMKSRQFFQTNQDSSLAHAFIADSLVDRLPASEWKDRAKAKINCNIGMLLANTNDKALQYFMIALKIEERLKDARILSLIYSGIGTFYANRSNYPLALEYLFRSLKWTHQLGDKRWENDLRQLVGTMYHYMKDYDKAEKYFINTLAVAEEIRDSMQISAILSKLAATYQIQKRYEEALRIYRRGMHLDTLLGNAFSLSINLTNVAGIYMEQKKYDEALDLLQKAVPITKTINSTELLAGIMGNIGVIQTNKGMKKEAEKSLRESIALSQQLGNKSELSEFEDALSQLLEQQGRTREAWEHKKNSVKYQNEIYNDSNKETALRLEMNYDFGKQEEKKRLERISEISQLENQRRIDLIIRISMVTVILLISLTIVFMRRAYVNKRKMTDLLMKDSERKEVLLQEVHHRINNNLQVISSLLDMQSGSVNDSRFTEMLQQSQSRIESLSKLHTILFENHANDQVNVHDYIERVLDYHRMVILQQYPDVSLASNIDQGFMPTRDAVAVALIVNELVTNSCKHAFKTTRSGRITVHLHEQQGQWKLMVSDSGPGIGAQGIKENGLGLRLTNILANQLKATMNTFNRNGAVFELNFN